MDLPVFLLNISDDENNDTEVNYIALVEYPAIQKNFLAFKDQFVEPKQGESKEDFIPRCISYMINEGKDNEQAVAICYNMWEDGFAESFKSYADYPDGVKGNAKRVLEYVEKNGWGSCGTPVGKQRANQLAKGEAISLETIKRMYSYLSRHEVDLDSSTGYSDGCGKLMYDAWGGKAALGWSRNKLRELGELKDDFIGQTKFAIQDEEQKIVSGPLMVADLPIYRRDEDAEYYVVFTADEIKKIVQRFFKKGYQSKVNIEHGKPVDGVYMYESYIIDREKGVMPPKGFEDISNGSWFGTFKVENESIWEMVKEGTFKGFSVEGLFQYKPKKEAMSDEEVLEKIKAILSI
jgi:hypothetical protein